jgi:DNA-binding transcriptional regulator GbsR (MarR family)
MSRISHFWGFPKAMGAIYGAIYLSPQPVSLDQLVEQVGVSKGAVSTNVRSLERLGIIHKHLILGDRKDYYVAEPDFWKAVKGVLREREKSEFGRALLSVDESLVMVKKMELAPADAETGAFYQERMTEMKRFFKSLDNLVSMVITLDELRSGTAQRLFGRPANRGSE